MPELPEVETTRRGIEPHVLDTTIADVVVRQRQLRWPVTRGIKKIVTGKTIVQVSRRGKYLLFQFSDDGGYMMIHLGMSGSLRLLPHNASPRKHDHVDIVFASGQLLRFHDPRRFGALLYFKHAPEEHPLLSHLGPEPLEDGFDGEYLFRQSRNRKVSIKQFIMDSKVVVGVGNIYANEALFLAGIRPGIRASSLSRSRCHQLVATIRQVLSAAVDLGGTTLRDFTSADGEPGYFAQSLNVYGRGSEDCRVCGASLKEIRQGQRSTVYCPMCQK
jgi:formamidopyrimidine-DNA glycosylase